MEQLIRFLRAIWLSIATAFIMCKSLWNRTPPSLPALPAPPAPSPEPAKNTPLAASSHCTIVATMDIFYKRKRSYTYATMETEWEETCVVQKTLEGYIRENCPGYRPLQLPLAIMTLLTQFNMYASPAENYRYALFLFGSGTLYDTPNVWTFMCNATLNEIETLLIDLNYDPELINDHAPAFQFSKSGHHFRITPLPGSLEEDVMIRIHGIQNLMYYKQTSLFCTFLGDTLYWIDSLNVLNPDRKQGALLELQCAGNTAEENAEIILQGIKFLAVHENSRATQKTQHWIEENKDCLSSPNLLGNVVELLLSGKSSRSLYLLKLFKLLDILAPDLAPSIATKAFNRGTANFDRQISHQFSKEAMTDYWGVLHQTLALFFYPARNAKNTFDWKTIPFIKPEHIPLIEEHWESDTWVARYWEKFIPSPKSDNTQPHSNNDFRP